MSSWKYVLITPAHNEEQYIEKTILSVLSQTVLPEKWVIVSDGSTDRTDEIVENYSRSNDFIELVHKAGDGSPNFGSKVKAFNAGYEEMAGIDYEFIGNLDADVSFEPDYFESVFKEFEIEPRLGLAGGIIREWVGGEFVDVSYSLDSVSGASQCFRRECFEDVGGYIPIDIGGEDSAAEIMARMHGWKVKTISACRILHHRRILSGKKNMLAVAHNKGVINYLLGYHPLFQTAVCLRWGCRWPFLLGALWMGAGYCTAMLQKRPRPVSTGFVEYLRKEQLKRIFPFFRGPKFVRS